jgi:hypothetical protein
VKKGQDFYDTCLTILRKTERSPSCILKRDLVTLAEKFGVDSSGTKPVLISKMLDKIEEEIVKASIEEKVNQYPVESCIVYTGRHLITIPVPEKYFNSKGQWAPMGAYQKYNTCKSCGFYLSTGTSNEGKNFPGMWFPFMRIREIGKTEYIDMDRGWITKAFGLKSYTPALKDLEKLGVPTTPFLLVFLEKFSYWWQVQISASLPSSPDSLWSVHPELIKLKSILMEYDYTNYDGLIRNPDIIKEYTVGRCERRYTEPEEVNTWLREHNALCENNDD